MVAAVVVVVAAAAVMVWGPEGQGLQCAVRSEPAHLTRLRWSWHPPSIFNRTAPIATAHHRCQWLAHSLALPCGRPRSIAAHRETTASTSASKTASCSAPAGARSSQRIESSQHIEISLSRLVCKDSRPNRAAHCQFGCGCPLRVASTANLGVVAHFGCGSQVVPRCPYRLLAPKFT